MSRAEDVAMEFGRLLIRNGRAWLPLTDADIERGARAVVNDPYYRSGVAEQALRHTFDKDPVLHAAISQAWDRLNERDGGDRNGHAHD